MNSPSWLEDIFSFVSEQYKLITSFWFTETGKIPEKISYAVFGTSPSEVLKAIETSPEKLIEFYGKIYDIPPDVLSHVKSFKTGIVPIDIITFLFIHVLSVFTTAGKFTHEFTKPISYSISERTQFELPDIQTLITTMIKYPHMFSTLTDKAHKLGYSDENQKIYKLSMSTRYTEEEVRDLFLRKEISKEDAVNELRRLGVDDETIENKIKLWQIIPSVNDIIRFAVKEAFSPSFIEQFKLLDEYPKELEEWGEKQGLSKYWTERFWIAHWNLPSVSQGFEMFHRGVITLDELKLLLKALDIPAFWREKLLQISYLPFTRIDIRRMYADGVLTTDEVFQAYKHIGYDDYHAQKLTEWTIKQKNTENKEITKAEIIKLMVAGVITEDETIEHLKKLGYSESDAKNIIAIEKYKEKRKIEEMYINKYKELYMDGVLTGDEIATKLREIGLTDSEIKMYNDIWKIEREGKMKRVTLSEYLKYVREGILSDEDRKEIEKRLNVEPLLLKYELDLIEKKEKRKPEKDLTKQELLQAFRENIVNENDARDYLIKLGYDKDEVNTLIQIEKYKITKDMQEKAINRIRTLFLKNAISEWEARNRLTELGLDGRQIEYYIYTWSLEIVPMSNMPTKDDLIEWLKKKIITTKEFRSEMRKLNFNDIYITNYIKAIIPEYSYEKELEQEREKEAEK